MKTLFLSSFLPAAFAQYSGYYSPPPMNDSTTSVVPEAPPVTGVPVSSSTTGTSPVSFAPQNGYYGASAYYGSAMPSYYGGYYGVPNMGYYSPPSPMVALASAPVAGTMGQPSAQVYSAYYGLPMMAYYGAAVAQSPTQAATPLSSSTSV
jgi:hypothetical protein